MPRTGRVVLPDYPHHVVQRGHNRQVVFAEPMDYRYYLETLAEFKAAFGVRVYAFCLMTNHVHLLFAPDTRAVQRGQLTGSARFVNEVERIIGKRIEQRRPGRPKCEK